MDFLSKLRKSEEEKFIQKAIKTNGELLEHLDSTIRYLLHYCEKNKIILPNEYQLKRSVERSQELLRKLPTNPILPTESKHYKEPTDNETAPKMIIFLNNFPRFCA